MFEFKDHPDYKNTGVEHMNKRTTIKVVDIIAAIALVATAALVAYMWN